MMHPKWLESRGKVAKKGHVSTGASQNPNQQAIIDHRDLRNASMGNIIAQMADQPSCFAAL